MSWAGESVTSSWENKLFWGGFRCLNFTRSNLRVHDDIYLVCYQSGVPMCVSPAPPGHDDLLLGASPQRAAFTQVSTAAVSLVFNSFHANTDTHSKLLQWNSQTDIMTEAMQRGGRCLIGSASWNAFRPLHVIPAAASQSLLTVKFSVVFDSRLFVVSDANMEFYSFHFL